MRSLITSLAFQAAAASGQTGRAISDADVRRFMREVGASEGDPRAIARVLQDVAQRTARRYRFAAESAGREPRDLRIPGQGGTEQGGVDLGDGVTLEFQ